MAAFINGPKGAACTARLKKRVRKEWERSQSGLIAYVWGMDASERERERAENLRTVMPDYGHFFPLIENNLVKEDVHKILAASGIKRPKMYELGYSNNNCMGCVKGGMGYWNKIRQDFPEVFASRAQMERAIGARCLKEYYLDELPPDAGRDVKPICDECGIFCELMSI